MTINLSIGFQDLENTEAKDEKSKTYALLLVDTVRVTGDGGIALTDAPKGVNNVFFFFEDEGDDDKEVKSEEKTRAAKAEKKKAAKSAILNSKFRSEEQDEESREQKRKAHQKELAAQKLAEGLKRFSESAENSVGEQKAVFRRFESYKSDAKLPNQAKDLRVCV
jgi:nucleosome binding factor SPN SPT16 subunit